jgi:EAL and modified HD-GYP domain-containing signal transduction protein
MADIVKVDFRALEPLQRAAAAKRCSRPGVRLLAEKIETRQELAMAMQTGYSLYQGYFFCKPEVVSRTEVPAYKLNYLRILQEVGRPEIDFDGLERIVRQDVSLSIKLLRYINSALFGLRSQVESIKHALVLVGVQQMRKWVALLALSAMGGGPAPRAPRHRPRSCTLLREGREPLGDRAARLRPVHDRNALAG